MSLRKSSGKFREGLTWGYLPSGLGKKESRRWKYGFSKWCSSTTAPEASEMRALRKFLLSGDGGVKLLNSPGFLLGMSSREIYRDLKRMIDRVGPAMEHDLGGGKMLITFN